MSISLTTERLLLQPLNHSDAAFILSLLNTPGWLQYIGDRQVHTPEDAAGYINRILSNANVQYWVVWHREQQVPMGIVTYLQRDFLPGHDIGFAFLDAYHGQGYAFEATQALMQHRPERPLYAIVLPENAASIKLLQRLGFTFYATREEEGEQEHIYNTGVAGQV